MSKQVQYRRGSTAQHATFTGAPGEMTIDTTKHTVVVHNGVTAGGYPVALETHNHAGVYEPADATILKDADIGVNVEAYDATILKDADIGVNVEAYDATILKDADIGVNISAQNHNHSGVYEPADATILKDADIGVNVQAYDATYLVDADIGVNVQAYSASNALTTNITYETLNANGDVGTTAGTLAIGDHIHTTLPNDVTVTSSSANSRMYFEDTNTTNAPYIGALGDELILQAPSGTHQVTVSDNLIVTGNLTVSGTTTYIDTNTLNIADNQIVLNADEVGAPSQNAGIEIERGTSSNVGVIWNETTNKWTLTNDGTTYNNILTIADEGTGNGLDADTLDTYHASSFPRLTTVNTFAENQIIDGSLGKGWHVTHPTTNDVVGLNWSPASNPRIRISGSGGEQGSPLEIQGPGDALYASFGSSAASVTGSMAVGGILKLHEFPSNGTNSINLAAPNSVITDRTWYLPAEDPTTLYGQVLTSSTGGQLNFTHVVADTRLHKYTYIADYDDGDPLTAATGFKTYMRDGVWHINKNTNETNDLSILIDGGRVLTTLDEGIGNGLDADTVDGYHASQFMKHAVSTSYTYDTTINNSAIPAGISSIYINGTNSPSGDWAGAITLKSNALRGFQIASRDTELGLWHRQQLSDGTDWNPWAQIWSSDTDGHNSGLDADTLDTVHASSFLRSDINTHKTAGSLVIDTGAVLSLGTNSEVSHQLNGGDYYTDIKDDGSWFIRDVNSSHANRFQLAIGSGNAYIGGKLTVGTTAASGVEGGEIGFTKAPSGTMTEDPFIDIYNDAFRMITKPGGNLSQLSFPTINGSAIVLTTADYEDIGTAKGTLGENFCTIGDGTSKWARVGSWEHTASYSHFHGWFKFSGRNGLDKVYIETYTGATADDLGSPVINQNNINHNMLATLDTLRVVVDTSGSTSKVELWVKCLGWSGTNWAALEDWHIHSGVTNIDWATTNEATQTSAPTGVSTQYANTGHMIISGFLSANGNITTGGTLYVGNGLASSYIYMKDSDDGDRIIHCNDNRIGFLTQGGSWAAWSEDDGDFRALGNIWGKRLTPSADNAYDIGTTTLHYDDIYATNNVINTSDGRLKDNILDVDQDKAVALIAAVRPVTFKWKDYTTEEITEDRTVSIQTGVDEDGLPIMEDSIVTDVIQEGIEHVHTRTHSGLIAQELETALTTAGLDPDTTAAFVHDTEADAYGVRYTELISPMISVIQKLLADKTEAESRMDVLEARLLVLESQ